jgi:hypothetical protein
LGVSAGLGCFLNQVLFGDILQTGLLPYVVVDVRKVTMGSVFQAPKAQKILNQFKSKRPRFFRKNRDVLKKFQWNFPIGVVGADLMQIRIRAYLWIPIRGGKFCPEFA